MALRIETLEGQSLIDALDAVAGLRIQVFRAYPYLYDGDMGYEAAYLAEFAASPGAIIIAAWDGTRLVGAATGAPMEGHAEAFGAPFAARGYDLGEVFYCAESVLLPPYRGHGVGHAFFDRREAQARALGRRISAFCAVVRPADHPLQPEGYRPLDGFWRKRGYKPVEGLIAGYSWKDIGQPDETEKPMQFWTRSLEDPAPD